jgi:hypothetical protein
VLRHKRLAFGLALVLYTVNMDAQQPPQLHAIVNLPETVPAFGRKYLIGKFNLGQMAQALEYSGYIGVLIVQAMKLGGAPSHEDLISFVTQGVGVASPAFIPIISIATKEPIQWIEEQDDHFGALEIFAKVVQKNRDFFTPENVARVKQIFAGLLPETLTSGGASSTTSSTTDTTSTPSSTATP